MGKIISILWMLFGAAGLLVSVFSFLTFWGVPGHAQDLAATEFTKMRADLADIEGEGGNVSAVKVSIVKVQEAIEDLAAAMSRAVLLLGAFLIMASLALVAFSWKAYSLYSKLEGKK